MCHSYQVEMTIRPNINHQGISNLQTFGIVHLSAIITDGSYQVRGPSSVAVLVLQFDMAAILRRKPVQSMQKAMVRYKKLVANSQSSSKQGPTRTLFDTIVYVKVGSDAVVFPIHKGIFC